MSRWRCWYGYFLGGLLILWLCYLCDQVMSRYGIYEIFSYSAHELLSTVPLVCSGVTAVAFAVMLVKGLRRRDLGRRAVVLALLAALTVGQGLYLRQQSQMASTTTTITVQSLDSRTQTLQGQTADGTPVELTYPMLVGDLLRTDGTEYSISYEHVREQPQRGQLTMVWAVLGDEAYLYGER